MIKCFSDILPSQCPGGTNTGTTPQLFRGVRRHNAPFWKPKPWRDTSNLAAFLLKLKGSPIVGDRPIHADYPHCQMQTSDQVGFLKSADGVSEWLSD